MPPSNGNYGGGLGDFFGYRDLLAVVVPSAVALWALFGPLSDALLAAEEEYLLGVARASAVALAESDAPPTDALGPIEERTRVRLEVVGDDVQLGRGVDHTHRDQADLRIAELGVDSKKDMGRVMSALKERYPGRMDLGKASAVVKQALA